MALTHDGWHRSGHTDCIDTWVKGFDPEEIEAMCGHHLVRVFRGLEPGHEYLSFTIYEDDPDQDLLDAVQVRNEQGSYCDVLPPPWLCGRIRAILPEVTEENIDD
jgi:hypothetical protein